MKMRISYVYKTTLSAYLTKDKSTKSSSGTGLEMGKKRSLGRK
jgi:hypothetical protein